MKIYLAIIIVIFFSCNTFMFAQEPTRLIVITAHPDEAEEYCGGTIAFLKQYGAAVKIVSATNGDVGHYKMSKKDLAERRKAEAFEAGKILGAEYEILNHHDGELEANVAFRKELVKIIREWKPDIVITFKEMFGGGHPDNMVVAKTVREIAGLSMAPLFLPEIPVSEKKPIFLLVRDYYSKSFEHKPDIVIPIDEVIDLKYLSFAAHASQFFEFAPFQRNLLKEVPSSDREKRIFLEKYWGEFSAISNEMRLWLNLWYGSEKAVKIKTAEEFEFASYSRKSDRAELIKLFPMLE